MVRGGHHEHSSGTTGAIHGVEDLPECRSAEHAVPRTDIEILKHQ
jgi:hypothetical protein